MRYYLDRLLALCALPVCVGALVLYRLHALRATAWIGTWLEAWPGQHHSVRAHGSDLYHAGKYGRGRYCGGRVFRAGYAPWSPR